MSNDFKPAFKGCMSMPLYAPTAEEMIPRLKTYDDWQTKTKRIFKRGRRFKVMFYLFDVDGHKRVHSKIAFIEKSDKYGLTSTIREWGNKFMAEHNKQNPKSPIDLRISYATVRA